MSSIADVRRPLAAEAPGPALRLAVHCRLARFPTGKRPPEAGAVAVSQVRRFFVRCVDYATEIDRSSYCSKWFAKRRTLAARTLTR